MIEASRLWTRYGPVDALRGIDLRIGKGEFLTLFGPNGAGKSTLLKILSTIIKPTSGKVNIDGIDLSAANEDARKRIGVISHKAFLYGNLSAKENLLFFGKLYDVPNLNIRVDELLSEVGLKHRADDMVRTFSRGMLQRLTIARAIIHNPAIILLDEPYTGLDQHASKMLSNLLKKLHTEDKTIVMTTHDITNGLEISDRIVIQLLGRVVFEDRSANQTVESFERVYFEKVGEQK